MRFFYHLVLAYFFTISQPILATIGRNDDQGLVSHYIGNGELAEAIATIDSVDRERRRMERQRAREERESHLAAERRLVDSADSLRSLIAGVLLANGFHTHHGTWRKRRG